jgi:hypothetical protein
MHQSVATLDNPEFINLQPLDINPLMSACEIKVLYTGKNRNKSFISKEVATEMAKTLRGAPIVGYYKKDSEDFADHGHQIIIDDEGVKFECKTVPYGFVSPDAQVWFQKFDDTDEFGNVETREYLMTTGYLWTGQFEECQAVIDNGKPHSMELDKNILDGHWSTDNQSGMEFFIVNDAVFSKLCILGDKTEPCFEGSSVTAPQVSASFSIDNDFTNTLYNMMQQLNFALQGGQEMAKKAENTKAEVKEPTSEFTETTAVTEEVTEVVENSEFAKEDEDKKEKSASSEKDNSTESKDSEDSKDEKDSEEDDKKKDKYSLEETEAIVNKYNEVTSKFEALSNEFAALKEECDSLKKFKSNIETEKKHQLIDSFYMLSDADKKDVTDHITEYSLDDIEAKLSVICVRKKVSFDLAEDTSEETPAATTFSLEEDGADSGIPAWIASAKRIRDSK